MNKYKKHAFFYFGNALPVKFPLNPSTNYHHMFRENPVMQHFENEHAPKSLLASYVFRSFTSADRFHKCVLSVDPLAI